MKILINVIIFLGLIPCFQAQSDVYMYDNLGRLTKVEYSNGAVESITYDDVGNRMGYELDVSGLPVELLEFTAYPAPEKKPRSILEWKTSSEYNTDMYHIEHSLDGRAFFKIGRKKAAGYSDSPLTYIFAHENPRYGINYYRLITKDFDSTEDKSRIVTVFFEENYTILLYPNPSSGITSLQINGELGVATRFELNNELGHLIPIEILPAGRNRWDFDTSFLAPGVYQLRFVLGTEYKTLQIVVEQGW